MTNLHNVNLDSSIKETLLPVKKYSQSPIKLNVMKKMNIAKFPSKELFLQTVERSVKKIPSSISNFDLFSLLLADLPKSIKDDSFIFFKSKHGLETTVLNGTQIMKSAEFEHIFDCDNNEDNKSSHTTEKIELFRTENSSSPSKERKFIRKRVNSDDSSLSSESEKNPRVKKSSTPSLTEIITSIGRFNMKNTVASVSKFNSDFGDFDDTVDAQEIDPNDITYSEDIADFHQYNKDCMDKIKHLKPDHQTALNYVDYWLDKSKYKKVVVFDLDETLVHCVKTEIFTADTTIKVELSKTMIKEVGINIRPGVKECLEKLRELKYDIVCYTASIKSYAQAVVNLLDPTKKLITTYLCRDHCILTKVLDSVFYVKDLRVFKNVDLSDLIIVDNSILSFAYHIGNGVPILPYYDNKYDRELWFLSSYLGSLVDSIDIAAENKKFIKYNNDESSGGSIRFESSLNLENYLDSSEIPDLKGLSYGYFDKETSLKQLFFEK